MSPLHTVAVFCEHSVEMLDGLTDRRAAKAPPRQPGEPALNTFDANAVFGRWTVVMVFSETHPSREKRGDLSTMSATGGKSDMTRSTAHVTRWLTFR